MTTKDAKGAKMTRECSPLLRVLRDLRSHPLVCLMVFARWYASTLRKNPQRHFSNQFCFNTASAPPGHGCVDFVPSGQRIVTALGSSPARIGKRRRAGDWDK